MNALSLVVSSLAVAVSLFGAGWFLGYRKGAADVHKIACDEFDKLGDSVEAMTGAVLAKKGGAQ